MVQTGMTAPFGAATPAAGFPTQNGEVKASEEKSTVPLLPPPTGAPAPGAGPPFSPPPPQGAPATEQPSGLVGSPVAAAAAAAAAIAQQQQQNHAQQTYKCESLVQVNHCFSNLMRIDPCINYKKIQQNTTLWQNSLVLSSTYIVLFLYSSCENMQKPRTFDHLDLMKNNKCVLRQQTF